MSPRPRFSLRTLLILTALVAAACWWWIARPTNTARRFAQAVESGDYARARRMLDPHPQSSVLETVFRVVPALRQELDQRSTAPGHATTADHSPFVITLEPLSWNDAFRRVRRFSMQVKDNNEIVSVILGLHHSKVFAASFLARPDRIEILTPDFAQGISATMRLGR